MERKSITTTGGCHLHEDLHHAARSLLRCSQRGAARGETKHTYIAWRDAGLDSA